MSNVNSAAREHTISSFFVFCLIGLFAVLATTLTLFGVRAYRSVYEASAMNSEGQIALSYLQNKVQGGNGESGILLDESDGTQVLRLRERLDGEVYETRIYYKDGSLCEYFCRPSDEFDPSDGEALTPLEDFRIELVSPRLMKVTIRQSGAAEQSAHIALRAGEVAVR